MCTKQIPGKDLNLQITFPLVQTIIGENKVLKSLNNELHFPYLTDQTLLKLLNFLNTTGEMYFWTFVLMMIKNSVEFSTRGFKISRFSTKKSTDLK